MSLGTRFVLTGLVLGGGAVALAVIIGAPSLVRKARPVAREALRCGLGLYEHARTAAAELFDDIEDLVAEVRAETTPGRTQENAQSTEASGA